MKKKVKTYSALSLVELMLSMVIIGIVILLVSITVTTMIKSSLISTAKTQAREESEFILELLRRTIRNSHTDDIAVYSVSGRKYNSSLNKTVDENSNGYSASVGEGGSGTEIHFRPVGYDRWVCVGYFPDASDENLGYLLKSTRRDLVNASECFDSTSSEYSANTILVNSVDIDINSLSVSYSKAGDDNYIMTIDLDVEPRYWLVTSGIIRPSYFRQTVVSTQKLTWE